MIGKSIAKSGSGLEKPPGRSVRGRVIFFVDAPIGIPDLPSGTNFAQHPPNTVVLAASSNGIHKGRLSAIPM